MRQLADLRAADAASYGGKSANLGELMVAGLRVPGGFALAAAADDAEVTAAYAALGDDPPVAVRSSAVGEDSADATFAGMQETFLWVQGGEAVCLAVRDCFASVHSERARAYREQIGAQGAPRMSVAVQRMVDAEVSGVLFTCNPVSGDRSTVAIDASWGLGLAVVGGEVTPDHYLVSKVTGELVKRTLGDKRVEYRRGSEARAVEDARRGAACLNDGQIAELLALARAAERHFGAPQDVEWAFADGELYALQSRPVTVRPRSAPAPAESALAMVMGKFGAPPREG